VKVENTQVDTNQTITEIFVDQLSSKQHLEGSE